jgi:hypothetical protein
LCPVRPGRRECRARFLRVKAMEGVENLDDSPEELLGVEGAERTDGDGGNWGGLPRPGGCGVRRNSLVL